MSGGEQRIMENIVKQTFLSLCLVFVAVTSFGQRPPAEPMAGADAEVGRPVSRQGPEKIETIQKREYSTGWNAAGGGLCFHRKAGGFYSAIFKPDERSSPNDKVHIVMPTAYSVSSGDGTFIHNENIDYVWEVLETGTGALMAVPVPLVESLGRAPLPCPCAGINGRCSYLQFCFETLPYIKCTMKPMQVEDPKLCLTLRGAERCCSGNQPCFLLCRHDERSGNDGDDLWKSLWTLGTEKGLGECLSRGGRVFSGRYP